MLSPERAVESLLAPGAAERWSVLGGEAVLCVDLGRESRLLDARLVSRVRERLAALPCVTIGVVGGARGGTGPLLDRFDVLADAEGEADAVREAVGGTPLAALALVQLLRLGDRLDPAGALICESLVYSTLQAGPEHGRWLAQRGKPRRRESAPSPAVRASRRDGRLALRLDRPGERNALSVEMRDALCEALEVAMVDPSIEEVLLSGEGPDFCSGGHLDEFGTAPDPATAHAVRSTRSPARALLACGARVHAQVHGACVGAGLELPAFCGHVSAAPDARFRLPEVGMGLVPGAGGTVSLPRRIGRQRTAWLALTGARIDAATALRWGLVDEITAPTGASPGRS